MGNFYRVTKRINGRYYDYWQRTYRVGKSVKTENKYIGPAGGGGDASRAPTRNHFAQPEPSPTRFSGGPSVSTSAPLTPEHAISRFKPLRTIADDHRKELERAFAKIRREDEEIQYGKLKYRIQRHNAKLRAAKKLTGHLKPLNYFVAKLVLAKNK